MKKLPIQLIINIILGLAVAALFVLHFTDNKNAGSGNNYNLSGLKTDSIVIAYINYDSLMSEYNFYHELSGKLESKKNELERQFGARQQKYETMLNDYNEKVSKGLVTRYEAKEMEDNLLQEQQNILAIRDQLTSQLMEEEQVLNRQLYYSITDFLNEYNKTKGYHYIFSYAAGGPIIYSNQAFDITREVIDGLNEQHAKQNKK